MLTGLINLFTKDPKQKLADEFIKFIETGDNELLKNYQIQIGSKKFNQDGNGYLNFILKNKATKEKEHFSVGITPFLCNQESGNYGQVFACIREKQNGKHTNIKTYEVTDKMYKRIQKLISNVTSSRDSRFQNIEDFAETYLSLNDNYVYPIAPTPLMRQITSDGAFDVKNGTATWINRQTNKTMGERPTLSGIEPTAVSVEESTAGMSTVAIASLATLGGLGLFLAGVGIKKLYDYRYKASRYDVTKPSPEGQRQPLNPENTSELQNNGGATVITMEQEPKATEPLLREGDNSAEGTVVSSPRAERHNSSPSGSRTSVHSNSTGVSEGNSFYI